MRLGSLTLKSPRPSPAGRFSRERIPRPELWLLLVSLTSEDLAASRDGDRLLLRAEEIEFCEKSFVFLFHVSPQPHINKNHSIFHPIEETAENPSAVQAKIPIYDVCLLPRRIAEQGRWCCFLMNCSPQKLFSSNDGFPRFPVTAHSWGSPCLLGQNSIHRPSSSIHCYLVPSPHPPPRSWPLPSCVGLSFPL